MAELATDTHIEEKSGGEAQTEGNEGTKIDEPSDDTMMSEEEEREKMLKAARQSEFDLTISCIRNTHVTFVV
jgi:hypothetical protein